MSTPSDGPAEATAPQNRFTDDNTPPAVRARGEASAVRKLCVGAKWFFCWLTDATYSFRLGGDGHGRVAIAQKDICRLTGVDRKSLSRWTGKLMDCRLVWIEEHRIPNAYPVNVYCIRELVPGGEQPQLTGLTVSWGRVRGDKGKFVPRSNGDQADGAGSLFPAKNDDAASHVPKLPPPHDQNSPLAGGRNGTGHREKSPLAGGSNGTCEAADFPVSRVRNGTGEAADFPVSRSQTAASEGSETDHLKESPKEIRRKGEKECEPTHSRLPRFEPLDLKCAARLRPQLGEKMIELCKEKIFAQENKRPPAPNVKEVIAAYKQRIRDVKSWVAGELKAEARR